MTRIPPTVSVGQTRNSLSISSLATPNGAAHGISNFRKSIALGSLGNGESSGHRRRWAGGCRKSSCRIGGTLTLDDLAETSATGDWKMPDFRAASAYAVSQGWLIVENDLLTLTAAGLGAA
jgi:hypothetical protein